MSTNKTPNYTLHSWVPGDNFLLNEINENFSAVDSAIAASVSGWTARAEALENAALRVVAGSYVGTGDCRESVAIELGFAPIAVLVMSEMGETFYNTTLHGGLAVTGSPVMWGTSAMIKVTNTGFEICDNCINGAKLNTGTHNYLAVG